MGVVYVEGTVTGPTGKQATVDFLGDSGAHVYTPALEGLARHRAKADGFGHEAVQQVRTKAPTLRSQALESF